MTAYFITAIVVLIIGIVMAMRHYADLKVFSLTLTAAITLAIIILAFPHFYGVYQDVVLALLSALRYGPSAISMSVSSSILEDLPMNQPLFGMYKALLYSLYLAGPMCASVAIISYTRLLGEWLMTLRYGTIHVFSRLEERSVSIAESIAATEKRQLIIFCNTGKVNNEVLKSRARAIHGMLLNKSETQIHLRRNRSYEFYEMADSSEKCLISATALCEDLLKEKNYLQKYVVVRIFIDRDSLEYIRRLDRSYGKKIYLRYVDADNSTAIEVLRKMKPWLINRKHLNIAFINAGKASQLMISQLIYLLTEPDSEVEMHVLDPEARALVHRMKMRSPEVLNLEAEDYLGSTGKPGKNYDISYHCISDNDYSVIEVLQRLKRPDVLVLGHDDDEVNLRLQQQLKRYYASLDAELSWPQMAVQITGSQLNKVLKEEEGIIYFGNETLRYNYQNIVHPELERAAKRTHLVYLSGQYGDILNQSPERQEEILEETGYYDYVNIDSSMANSLTLEYRYGWITAQKNDESLSEREWVLNWLMKPENLKKIGDGEHDRWNAYQRIQGWRRATYDQQQKLAADENNPRVKDNELMLHAALVSVEELPQAERQADELLGRATRYVQLDRDFYTHMLEILEK